MMRNERGEKISLTLLFLRTGSMMSTSIPVLLFCNLTFGAPITAGEKENNQMLTYMKSNLSLTWIQE